MSISFNGLASGLDTSSWVESLTALKRAKITSLQQEKEAITLSKDTLSGIKSFFNSFRNVIQKVTDIKFNVGTMDVFAQNIANSSNLKILTATASSGAVEGSYDITVDKLASNTKAYSGYDSTISVDQEITATENTQLSKLGIKAGRFKIGSSTISIAANDTLGTLTTKIGNAGYTAALDVSGIYSIDTGIETINDVDNTGIIRGLRLSGAAPGYEFSAVADYNTKLSSLGVSAGLVELSDKDGNEYLLELEDSDTIGDFITALAEQGISADINNGVLTIENANITNDTSTKLISALGLQEQTTEILSDPMLAYDTVKSILTIATKDTALNDLQTNVKVKEGDTVIVKDSSNANRTITLSSTETIESLRLKLSDIGTATYSERSGTFSFYNEIVGGTYDIVNALGLSCFSSMRGIALTEDPTVVDTSISSDRTISYTVTTTATGTSKLSDCGVDKTWFTLLNNEDGAQETLFLEKDATFNDLINLLSQHGVSSSISNGIFTINSDNTYLIKDGTAEQLGMALESSPDGSSSVWLGYYAKGAQSTEKSTVNFATRNMDSCVAEGPNGEIVSGVYNFTITLRKTGNMMMGGANTVTIAVNTTTTYNDLNSEFNHYGLNIECDNEGIFRIAPTEPNATYGYYIDSDNFGFLNYLNINQSDLRYIKVQGQYKAVTEQTSNELESHEVFEGINHDTTFGMLGLNNNVTFSLNNGTYTTTITSTTKVQDFGNWLNRYGLDISYADNKVTIVNNGSNNIDNTKKNYAVLKALGINIDYASSHTHNESNRAITENTRLWDLVIPGGYGFNTMQVNAYEEWIHPNDFKINGVAQASVLVDSTIGELFDRLEEYGIQGSIVNGAVYLTSEQPIDLSGAFIENLLSNNPRNVTYTSGKLYELQYEPAKSLANESTKLKALGVTSGEIVLSKGGNNYTINIDAEMTLENFAIQLMDYDLFADFNDHNAFTIQSDENFSFLKRTGGSNILDVLLVNKSKTYTTDTLKYKTASANAVASDSTLTETITTTKEGRASAAGYAISYTKFKDLNITSGSFTLFKNGEKKIIQIEEDETFRSLRIKLRKIGIGINQRDGYIRFYAPDGGVLTAGTNTDTSNITSLLGLYSDGNSVRASRATYRVNGNSTLTDSELFRRGDITEGTFTIGNAEFEITNTTTLNELIAQINSSNDSNATAYWDSVNGDLVIKSRTTGAALINIEKGTSNFTDILGYTKDGGLNIDYQEVGENAQFSINGTDFTSTSNTISSDISRIEGVTINLKDVSGSEKVTLTIEKDSETASNAMQDIVDSYNSLIENVDKEVSKEGNLKDQSTLKLIKNQLRSLMVNSSSSDSLFRNLSAIGITTEAASSGNIRTDNINKLSFNKDKFTDAFRTNPNALRTLLVGNDTTKGIFVRVEDVLESTLNTSGYFDSAERAYNSRISRLNDKITKQTASVDRYKERLEKKFKTMDLLISKIQQQYSSFLGT